MHGLVALLIIIVHFVYLIHVANTIQEYILSIFMVIILITVSISFVSTANKSTMIFDAIGKIENILHEGKVNVYGVMLDTYQYL